MITRILLAAVFAGLISGVVITPLHGVKLWPVIFEAERYENTVVLPQTGDAGAEHDHGDAGTAHEHGDGWAPGDGLERTLFSAISNIIAGVGFALLLVAAFSLSKREITWQKGLLWGLGGFAAFALAPAMLLPPELPAAAAAPLELRQTLWIGTALATALGLLAVVFAKPAWAKAAGLFLIAAPHFIPTPHISEVGAAPPELAAQFVALSLGLGVLFWLMIGGLSGYFFQRATRVETA